MNIKLKQKKKLPSWKIHLIEIFIIIATANNIMRVERWAWEFERIIAFLRFSSSSSLILKNTFCYMRKRKRFYFEWNSFRLNLLIFIMQVVQLKQWVEKRWYVYMYIFEDKMRINLRCGYNNALRSFSWTTFYPSSSPYSCSSSSLFKTCYC